MTAGNMMPPEIEAESADITDITRGLTLETGNVMIERTSSRIVNCHSRWGIYSRAKL